MTRKKAAHFRKLNKKIEPFSNFFIDWTKKKFDSLTFKLTAVLSEKVATFPESFE